MKDKVGEQLTNPASDHPNPAIWKTIQQSGRTIWQIPQVTGSPAPVIPDQQTLTSYLGDNTYLPDQRFHTVPEFTKVILQLHYLPHFVLQDLVTFWWVQDTP